MDVKDEICDDDHLFEKMKNRMRRVKDVEPSTFTLKEGF